jgi:hypothetical protein
VSAVDPNSVPTLAEVLDRGEDPTDRIQAEHLADIIETAAVLSDARRPDYAHGERAMAWHFAENPPAEGDNHRRVLGLLWAAELTESPDLVIRLIEAVANPVIRADLAAHHQVGIEQRRANDANEARRRAAWREPPAGAEWHHIDEFILELYATQNGWELGDVVAEDLIGTVTSALEGFGPHMESVLRPLVPAGVDVQMRVSQ